MSLDPAARGLAARALARSPRTPIAIGVIGQSNERGNVLIADQAAYPQAFQSQRNPAACQVPIGPAQARTGGFWPKVHDELWDWGYDARIVNGAIGSMSFVKHGAGQMQFRNNGAVYYRRRAGSGGPDRGFVGDAICPNGNRVFRCTGGRDVAALNAPPFTAIGQAGVVQLDYVQYDASSAVSGATAPDFTTAAVGDVVTDGGISWTCESLTTGAYGGAGGTVFGEGQNGIGFDPFGILHRLHEEMQRVRGVGRKIVYMANGQSDQANTQTWYQAALVAQATFFLARGYEVMIGLTCYQPNGSNVANYDKLSAAVTGAIAALQAGTYGAKVYTGANLYQAMGTTGGMAAGGAYMQADNVHLNGAGALVAGGHIAGALKSVLPRIMR